MSASMRADGSTLLQHIVVLAPTSWKEAKDESSAPDSSLFLPNLAPITVVPSLLVLSLAEISSLITFSVPAQSAASKDLRVRVSPSVPSKFLAPPAILIGLVLGVSLDLLWLRATTNLSEVLSSASSTNLHVSLSPLRPLGFFLER